MVSVKHLETVPSATSVFWEEIPRRWGPWLELLKSFDHVKWICCASTYKDFWREEVLWCLFYVDFMMGIIFFNIYTCYLAFCVGWGGPPVQKRSTQKWVSLSYLSNQNRSDCICVFTSVRLINRSGIFLMVPIQKGNPQSQILQPWNCCGCKQQGTLLLERGLVITAAMQVFSHPHKKYTGSLDGYMCSGCNM